MWLVNTKRNMLTLAWETDSNIETCRSMLPLLWVQSRADVTPAPGRSFQDLGPQEPRVSSVWGHPG